MQHYNNFLKHQFSPKYIFFVFLLNCEVCCMDISVFIPDQLLDHISDNIFQTFWIPYFFTRHKTLFCLIHRLEDQTKKLHKDMKKSTEADLGVLSLQILH